MVLIGVNVKGEEVYGDAAGSRFVFKGGEMLGSMVSTGGFNPFNDLSDDRYKAVTELVEAVARSIDHDISGIGAAAGIRAMARHWSEHLSEGHKPSVLLQDLKDMQARIGDAIDCLNMVIAPPPVTPAYTACSHPTAQ